MDAKINLATRWELFKSAFARKAKEERLPDVNAAWLGGGVSRGTFLFSESFNGEKNLGEMGPVKNYLLDYESLRARAWEAYLTNPIVQIIINRMVAWIIGKGLKVQAEPNLRVLKQEGIILTEDQAHEFTEEIESRFGLFSESKEASYNGMKTLHQLEATAYKNGTVGGDVLVILRYIDGFPKVQLVDGCHVYSPMFGNDWAPGVLENGNRMMNGVEMNTEGQHVAYHVRNSDLSWTRVEAKSKITGLKMAYFVGGLEFRLDNSRTVSKITTVLETLSKLERYSSATLSTAEEVNKWVWQITHGVASTGENPTLERAMKARAVANNNGMVPVDNLGNAVADKVQVSTNRTTINMPNDSKIEPVDKNKSELYFKDFYAVFVDIICACFGIPPEVAMSKYDSNFSSARAAIKDWEHTIMIERDNFTTEFLKPIYDMFLEISILENKIQAPGYILGLIEENKMLLAAYRKIRGIGDNVPHIDPLKEVLAERLKLGDTGANMPLTTGERSTEVLNGGEFSSNLTQYAKELKTTKTLGIVNDVPDTSGEDPGKKEKDKKTSALKVVMDKVLTRMLEETLD